MSLVTIAWSMIAGACLTLGLLYFTVWASGRDVWANLAFTAAAIGVAGIALFELTLMNAESVDAFARAQRLAHLPAFATMVGLSAFVHFYFRAGLAWWLWIIVALRVVVLVVNFSGPGGVNFREITALAPFELFGETVSAAVVVPSPWTHVDELSMIALAAFTLQSALVLWRRNAPRDRQRAAVIGSAIGILLALVLINAFVLHTGRAQIPYFISPAFMIVVLAMSYELSVDLLRSAWLATELQNSLDRLELSSEAANLGFWEYDPGKDRLEVTEKSRELFGFSDSETPCMESWLATVHPEDLPAAHATATRFLQGARELRSVYRMLMKDGEVRWLSVQGRNTHAEDGHMHGIVMDITQNQQEKIERIRLWEQLAHIGRADMLGQLAASLAHELQQPLGAILRNSEAAELLMAADQPDLTVLGEIVTDIRNDDLRASKVIQRLRELLKSHHLESSPVDLPALTREVVALVTPEAAARGIRIEQALDPACGTVHGDPVHLQQVLLNLVMNGLDAAQLAQQGERFVALRTRLRDDRMAEFTISDSGPGVPPGAVNRIFESFYTTKGTGMGLGLSICRTIVEAHGGRIWLDADAGPGAVFRFTLPHGGASG